MSETSPTTVPPQTTESPAPPAATRWKYKIWFGPNGLRAGWRVALYFLIAAIVGVPENFIFRAIYRQTGDKNPLGENPLLGILVQVLSLALFLLPAVVMARLERRSLATYGLKWQGVTRFAEGTLWGFAGMSLLLGIMRFSGVFYYGTFEGFGKRTLYYGAVWAVLFLLVGLTEEFGFRGYVQYTLTSGLKFWPAALITSTLFLLAHRGNPGETPIGLVDVFIAGILLVVALWRTGALWFAIGIHLGWDWAQSFFYGVPDSGVVTKGHLFEGHSHGAAWLSGGTTGPEGSLFALLVQLAIIPLILWRFRSVQYPDPQSLPRQPGARI